MSLREMSFGDICNIRQQLYERFPMTVPRTQSYSRTKGFKTMSKASNRKMIKAIQKKMGIDPQMRALETALKNLKNGLAKSRERSDGTKPS
jgi:H2-forming N5,N10-methylenetetrahydromethanopterin dehydrogenase-like enzyme